MQNRHVVSSTGPAANDGLIRQHIQASETESQKKNPTKVEVYKVLDLIKADAQPGNKPKLPMPNLTPIKGSEFFINQVMQAPKLTVYEQLKRPRTNREDAKRLANLCVKSQAGSYNKQPDGVISSEQDIQMSKKRSGVGSTNPASVHTRDRSNEQTQAERSQSKQQSFTATAHSGFR